MIIIIYHLSLIDHPLFISIVNPDFKMNMNRL